MLVYFLGAQSTKQCIFCSISMFFCVYAFVNLDKYICITFYLWSCKKKRFFFVCKQSYVSRVFLIISKAVLFFCYFIFLQLPLRFPSFFSCVQYKIRFEFFLRLCFLAYYRRFVCICTYAAVETRELCKMDDGNGSLNSIHNTLWKWDGMTLTLFSFIQHVF